MLKIRNLSKFIILSSSFLMLNLSGNENNQVPTVISTSYTCSSVSDVEALKGFGAMTFFLSIPQVPSAKKVEGSIMKRLNAFGEVVSKRFSVQNPLKDGLSKNPFLTYEIQSIEDIHGKTLPVFKASLFFEASTRVEKNKQYCHSVLWSRSCFVEGDEKNLPENGIMNTLDLLFDSFVKDYQEANRDNPLKPVVYFAEL